MDLLKESSTTMSIFSQETGSYLARCVVAHAAFLILFLRSSMVERTRKRQVDDETQKAVGYVAAVSRTANRSHRRVDQKSIYSFRSTHTPTLRFDLFGIKRERHCYRFKLANKPKSSALVFTVSLRNDSSMTTAIQIGSFGSLLGPCQAGSSMHLWRNFVCFIQVRCQVVVVFIKRTVTVSLSPFAAAQTSNQASTRSRPHLLVLASILGVGVAFAMIHI